MNFYITSGTADFLEKLMEKHDSGQFTLVNGEDNAVLFHETDGESVFKEPRRYEIFDQNGTLTNDGFFVLNNIPVSEEGRPVFEHRFKNRAGLIEEEPGFVAIRLLRPVNDDTYVVLTQWKDEDSFTSWQTSSSYNKAHAKRGTSEGIDHQKSIFPRASFVTKYTASSREAE